MHPHILNCYKNNSAIQNLFFHLACNSTLLDRSIVGSIARIGRSITYNKSTASVALTYQLSAVIDLIDPSHIALSVVSSPSCIPSCAARQGEPELNSPSHRQSQQISVQPAALCLPIAPTPTSYPTSRPQLTSCVGEGLG